MLRMTWRPEFLERPTRNLFFTGKGGVGKTSLACASAIALAARGRRVLLVSTDPASNLDEVLGVRLSSSPTAVPLVHGLFALNVDPEEAARAYRARMVDPYRGVLPEATLASIEEQFSGACTLEIAAFDEFSALLARREATDGFDHVVFDTAPTGHTLRLLTLPSAWSGFLSTNQTGTSCLGPLAGLEAQQALYEATVKTLGDAALTTLVLVSRPDSSALQEASRTSAELRALGICNQHLVANGVFSAADPGDPVARALEGRGQAALQSVPEPLVRLPRTLVPLVSENLVGVPALRRLAGLQGGRGNDATRDDRAMSGLPPLAAIIDELAQAGRGVVMTMGKGGVGKTTIAAAVALELARRGHRVHLTTTDPAAHLLATLSSPVGGLLVTRIDPHEETRRYREEVLVTAGAGLDAQGRALLEEDLRSPCTEEVAVFRAFAAAIEDGANQFVVVDTAPTGHTILLLDAAEAYHREVLRQSSAMPESVRRLLPRLRDPGFTRVLLVTLAEATPVHEARQLQDDLERAGIHPFGWVVNQSFALTQTSDPVLASRARHELPYVDEVRTTATRIAGIPWMPVPPVGPAGIEALLRWRPVVEPTGRQPGWVGAEAPHDRDCGHLQD
jgi:arsenite/tail-anchored protein-transporting ATPase